MIGLSPDVLNSIRSLLEEYFDDMTLALLGLVVDDSTQELVFDTEQNNLVSLYVKSLNSEHMTIEEEDTLKTLLGVTHDYTEALKSNTKASVVNSLNSYAQGQNNKKEFISSDVVESIINKQMEVAENKFKVIASAQSNVTKNVGLSMAYTKMAEQQGENEAIVFFRPVPVDERTAPATLQVHLLPDQVTPRLYYMKEVNMNYYKKGDKTCSIFGTHPYCRCVFSYLANSYGFDSEGKVVYKEKGHNELLKQREQFPL